MGLIVAIFFTCYPIPSPHFECDQPLSEYIAKTGYHEGNEDWGKFIKNMKCIELFIVICLFVLRYLIHYEYSEAVDKITLRKQMET